jgi:hypothetical protein
MTRPHTETITLTFGDAAENHAGMQQIFAGGAITTVSDDQVMAFHRGLLLHKDQYNLPYELEIINLVDLLPEEIRRGAPNASILIVRGGLPSLMLTNPDELFAEMKGFGWDKKFYDTRRKKVLNKQARHNVCFGEGGQEPDYAAGKGTVVSLESVPSLNRVKLFLEEQFDMNLVVEGNRYHDEGGKVYIGWHGDAERNTTMGLRLGASMSLSFCWFRNSKALGEIFSTVLNHGDFYLMSPKALGRDWRQTKGGILTLRHSAGDYPLGLLRGDMIGAATAL